MVNKIKNIKWTIEVFLLVIFLLGVISVFSLAMSSANYAINWDVINGGGDDASSGGIYQIKASVGQPAIDLTAATTYQSEGGYWSGVDAGVVFSYQTDNHIKNSTEGTYIGDNIYNSDGTNQTKAQSVDNDATATYHIRLENDGNTSDTFVVTGTGGVSDWTVNYYDALSGGSDITADVTGAGWSSGALASGANTEIRVEVTPGAEAGGGTFREILVTSTSQGDSNIDAVKACTACGSFEDEGSCSFTDIVPEFIELEKEEALLKISINVPEHDAIWNSLRIGKIGTIQDINVVAVRVYLDNGNQEFDGSDTLFGEGTFSNGEVDIEFTTPQTINTAIKSYFVTCEIGANAGIGTTIGITCDPGLFSIALPDSMDSELYCFDTKTATIVEVIISKARLHPNFPNPFRPGKGETTTIQYDLGEDANSIEIEIYSLSGGLVRKWSGNTQRGRHRIIWDASNQGGRMISSGMYFIVIKKNGKIMDRSRIVVIK
ncbi:T9SS type A sorting domain-containing protein [bacterium]|nr:T9SS type A sorting domain-containing protein [bacterium]